uniref:Cytochrome c biogenesis protein CcsA n=1 Tax=Cyanoptyche gloeocystis TaxID=77922 RepID=A0A3G1IWK5_9EUKA|nr:cytochrome c biogenesis protein [Cyanoptyche gloeocystis]
MDLILTQTWLEFFSIIASTIVTISYITSIFFKKIDWLKLFGTSGMICANIAITILLGVRWYIGGYFPLSNLYESLFFLTWSLIFIHLLVERFINEKLNSIIGLITSPLITILCFFIYFFIPVNMRQINHLSPALKSIWLMMHVSVMMLSYATLIIGALFSITFLLIGYITKIKKNRNTTEFTIKTKSISGVFLEKLSSSFINKKIEKFLDHSSYKIIGIGFSLLTLGIIAGAVWANEAWGSYWSWDPKETWALITWLIFASYLHTRITRGWQGKKPAIIASIGFFIIWFCYLGVNLLGKGVHSYGWFF